METYSRLDNYKLNKFYDDRVKMKRESVKKSVAIVMPVIHQILTKVNKQDPRFKIEPLNMGSYYQHLKIRRADEFDFNVVFETGAMVWSSRTPCFYRWDTSRDTVVKTNVPLPEPEVGFHEVGLSDGCNTVTDWRRRGLNEGSACVTFEGDLIPGLVKRRFNVLVTDAVRQLGLRDTVRVAKLWESSPTTILTIKYPGHHEISVDLSPLVLGPKSFPESFKWPHRGTRWPLRDTVSSISSMGVDFIARTDLHWQNSFGSCEKELLENIDADGGCRKKSHRIMKRLKDDVWCPNKELTSFPLKNILFWECENYPNAEEWGPDQLARRIDSMTRRLLRHLRSGVLPLFFRPEVNLLKEKDENTRMKVVGKIERFLDNPDAHLVHWKERVIVAMG